MEKRSLIESFINGATKGSGSNLIIKDNELINYSIGLFNSIRAENPGGLYNSLPLNLFFKGGFINVRL